MSLTYDVHTHVGVDAGFFLRGWWPYASMTADLLLQMDAAGIDRAVCFPFTLPSAFDPYAFSQDNQIVPLPGRFPFDRENVLLAGEIERIDRDHRLLQFAMFDPSREIERQVGAIKPLLGKIHGLKTQSTVIRSPVRALLDAGKPLMQLAADHNLPVLFHTSVNDPWAQVSDCLAVARAYPSVRFNLAHSCRLHLPLLRECAKTKNVWVDCSAHLAHCHLARHNLGAVAAPDERVQADYHEPAQVLETIHALLGEKYMWGSDNPYMSWCDDKLRILFTYKDEINVVRQLPESIQASMLTTGPSEWLNGNRV